MLGAVYSYLNSDRVEPMHPSPRGLSLSLCLCLFSSLVSSVAFLTSCLSLLASRLSPPGGSSSGEPSVLDSESRHPVAGHHIHPYLQFHRASQNWGPQMDQAPLSMIRAAAANAYAQGVDGIYVCQWYHMW